MSKEIEDIRREEREEGREEGIEIGNSNGISMLIKDNIEEGKTKDQIIPKLVRLFQLPLEKAEEYFERFKAAEEVE